MLCVCLISSNIYVTKAQEDVDPVNTGAANFLTISTDARSSAMGATGTAVSGKDHAIFHNAATSLLDDDRTGGATYTFTPWMREHESGHSLHSIGGFYKINPQNAILAGFRYYNYPKVGIMEEGIPAGKEIRPKEMAIDIAYAREITLNLALSATLRYIHSDMGAFAGAKSSNAVAFDLGAFYKGYFPGINESGWTVGLTVANIGTKLKYLDKKESLPALAKLGGSVDLPVASAHRLMFAADLGYRLAPSDISALNAGIGAEYTAIDLISVRGGYHYGDKNKADASYATAGVGVKYTGVHLDFAWLFAESDSPLNNTFQLSLGYSF